MDMSGIPAFKYESIRDMPALARVLTFTHGGWIVGGAAKYMVGEGPQPRDWDIIVPPIEWPRACKSFPVGSLTNTFGGIKAMCLGGVIDAWPSDLGDHFITNGSAFDCLAVHPRTQQVCICTKR